MKQAEHRRCVPGCMILILLLLWAGLAAGEKEGKTVTGYFPYRTYLRPSMERTTERIDSFPAYTVLTLQVVNDTWGTCVSSRGKTGYINYSKMQPLPEYVKEKEQYVYGEDRVDVRSLPFFDAPTVYSAQADELLIRDGSLKGYIHVVTADGTEGYILPAWVKKAVFRTESISPVLICVSEEQDLLDMPLRGAHRVGSLRPDQLYRAEGTSGKYYAVALEDGRGYIMKSSVAVCNARDDLSRAFFSFPRGGTDGTARRKAESMYTAALVREEGAMLRRTDGKEISLPGEARITLYAEFGEWYGAVYRQQAGYLRRDEAEKLTVETMMAKLRRTDLSGGSIARNPLLDQAFSMVEEGNPFQARYNLLTGAEVQSLLPLGVPYFWGGRSYTVLLERQPLYAVREAWQSSRVYYQKGTAYLYGFDCIGFVKAVYSQAGTPIEGTVTEHGAVEFCRAGQHVFCSEAHPLPEDWREAARAMQVGDIMVIHHPGTHAMMYLGTLREFGYTEEQLPALAKYLDYPLMLQSGENPYSYVRFRNLIQTTDDVRTAGATPSDGGVGICILGVLAKDAEMVLEYHDSRSRCFEVEGSCVTIMGFGNVRDYFVYRMGAGEPVSFSFDAGADDMEIMEEPEGPEGPDSEFEFDPGETISAGEPEFGEDTTPEIEILTETDSTSGGSSAGEPETEEDAAPEIEIRTETAPDSDASSSGKPEAGKETAPAAVIRTEPAEREPQAVIVTTRRDGK